jgi:intracellular septation protein
MTDREDAGRDAGRGAPRAVYEGESVDAAGSEDPSALKLALDLGPLIAFFVTYYFAGLYWATGVIIATTLAALVASRVAFGKLPLLPIISAALIVVLGSLTLWLNDDRFVKMKPTIAYLVFAALLLGGLALGRSPLKAVVGRAFSVTDAGWRLLTIRWGIFFLCMAAFNELLWRNFSEQTWVTFKTFGFLTMTIIFMALQKGLLERHSKSLPRDAKP